MAKRETSLLSFINATGDGERAIGFLVSIGAPAGDHQLLDDPDYASWVEGKEGDLHGAVDADGIWRWDGHGDFADPRGNTIMRIDAWYGGEAQVEEILGG